MAEIKQRISLDGAEDVAGKLKKIGDAGEDAFGKLDQHSRRGGESFRRLGQDIDGSGTREAGERLREALHTLHPVLDEAGLGLTNLGAFARLAGAGMVPLGAAIVGSVLVGLAKMNEESQKAKQRLVDLAHSPEAGEQLYKGLQKNADATGIAVKGAGGYVENLLRLREKMEAQSGLIRVAGKPVEFGPLNDKSLVAAEKVLTQQGIIGGLTADKSKEMVAQFGQSLYKNGGLTPDLIDQVSRSSPGLGNFLSRLFGGPGETSERFKLDLGRGRFRNLTPDEINRQLALQEGATQKQFEQRPHYFSDTLEQGSRNRERAVEDILEGSADLQKKAVGPGGPLLNPYAPPLSPANTGMIWRPGQISPELGPDELGPPAWARARPQPPAPFIPDNNAGWQIAPPSAPRSEGDQDATKNVTQLGGAAGQAADGLAQFASAISEAIGTLRGGNNAPAAATEKAGGGLIRLDGGGHVRGPGTSTSDSIPARLSDGEYVVKASSVSKLGVGYLNWLNAGKFADGGQVTALGGGDHQITYDPDTGGAWIDGNLHMPGDPILNDPIVQQAIAQSKAGMNEGASSRRKHKSDFTGIFGGHVFDTEGSYAHGGLVGRFASGGAVDFGSALDFSAPLSGRSASLSDLAPASGGSWGDMPHFGTMDLRTDHGDARVMGSEDVLRHMERAARTRALTQAGTSPSWRR